MSWSQDNMTTKHMIRRKFLGFIIVIVSIGFAGMFSFNTSCVRKIYYKIRIHFNPPSGPQPDSIREEVTLPKEGFRISVETALNSRCTSDYDGYPRYFHWGIFDKSRKLSPVQIEQIISYANISYFTKGSIKIKSEKNMLTFSVDNRVKGQNRDWMMVESGMQQQAVGLVCAALGIGYVFSGLGVNGKSISDNEFATVKIKLDAMKPSYDGEFWSITAPTKTKPLRRGTLPDPAREGKKPLLSSLGELRTTNNKGRKATIDDFGQLLWAARGRTPHFVKSAPWGMTIPTYSAEKTITEVYMIATGTVSKYINCKANNPTHFIERAGNIDITLEKLLTDKYIPYNCFIILRKNETSGRALWEIGYQLLNLMLQAQSLGVQYKAILLDESQKKLFQNTGIKEAVAVLLLQSD